MVYRDEFRNVQREAFWSFPRVAFGLVLVIALFYGVGFLMTGGDLAIYSFWAPKQANAERKVFENTQSFVQGKTEYLNRLRFQYQEATGDHKKALRSLIISEASTVDNDKLPLELQGFISQITGAL